MNLYSVLIFYRQKLASGILVMDVFCLATVGSALKSGTIGIGSDRRIYDAEVCLVPPGVQADVPVSVT